VNVLRPGPVITRPGGTFGQPKTHATDSEDEMFLGHYAVGLASKRAAPGVSLGTLFLAAQCVDLLWPLFLLLGLEHVRIDPGNTVVTPLDFYDYPITHSLVGAVAWSVALGLAYFFLKKSKRAAVIIGLVVFSHWILDLITHRPDLSLGLGSGVFVGFGLWNSVPGTLIAELGLFAFGIFLYTKTTVARDRIGSIGFWSLIALLALIYVGNISGPPPPSAEMISILGNAAWLFVVWGYWVDAHRTARLPSSSPLKNPNLPTM
jgi:hypothetical protein